MTCDLAHMRASHAQCSNRAGRGAPRVARELAYYKRASVQTPLVCVLMTSAFPCRGRWPRPGALFEVTDVGGPP